MGYFANRTSLCNMIDFKEQVVNVAGLSEAAKIAVLCAPLPLQPGPELFDFYTTFAGVPSPKSANRVAEFWLGREAARRAILKLGVAPEILRREADGLAIWPRDVFGSISHSIGRDALWAAAAATRTDHGFLIGVDLEARVRRRKSDASALAARICHESELRWVNEGTGPEECESRSLLCFSAKESIYKALYPVTRQFMRFSDVVLSAESPTKLRGRLTSDFTSFYRRGFEFSIYAVATDEYLLSIAAPAASPRA